MDRRIELLQRRLERERIARKHAEQIIEEKSRDLYARSRELERTVAAERQARSEVETLLMAFETFTSRLNCNEILVRLEAVIKEVMPYDTSTLYLFDGGSLKPHNSGGASAPPNTIGPQNAPTVLVNNIMGASRPLILTEGINNAIAAEWCIPSDTKTWMAVPISSQGQHIGCLTLGSRKIQAFCTARARLAQAIANEAAIAFVNARLFEEVQKLSTVDPLTGLFNRRHFNHVAQVELDRAERYGLPLSAIMMDIDHFKQVNDRYGHAAGDTVLVAVANLCRCRLRSMDILARYGGEEFCFVLPETPLKGALSLAERLRAGVCELRFESEKECFIVTASFGIAEHRAEEDSTENLLNRSDQALYEAKRSGRNRIMKWTPEIPSSGEPKAQSSQSQEVRRFTLPPGEACPDAP